MSSKNKQKAQQTKNTVSASPTPTTAQPQPCVNKHWFGIRVKDDQGNQVTDVKVRVLLNSGTTIEPGLGVNGEYRTGLILDTAGSCTVSFPDLVDCEWWPDGSSAPAPADGGKTMTVADGDCTVSLAVTNGYRDYHSIWDASQNADLKKTRTNPNCLAVADTIYGPAVKTKTVDKPADAFAEFVVKSKRTAKVRMVLVDKDLNPLNGWAWQLITPSAASGTTGGDGKIEFDDVDPTKTIGTLKVTIKKDAIPTPSPGPTPGPASSPPPYPPPIDPKQYVDKAPDPPDNPDTMEWTIKVGSLPPAKTPAGVKARLHDFGFSCDLDSDDTKAGLSIKNFQKIFLKKTETGAYADVQDDLDSKFSQA